jgi:hypothetical protein
LHWSMGKNLSHILNQISAFFPKIDTRYKS